ncbi:hypothetical protein T484DRAFT_1812257 [Baffinella frigidus]|nr:hypothetical protein T484DRAFT_1812257 [Cryptophyta sp. CCMP2293]
MSGATRILVTHRVDLLRKVPKILALKDGKELIEQGIDLDEHQDDQEHTDQNPAAAATSASDGKMTRVPSGDKEGAGEKEAIKPQASLITEEERKSGEVSGSTWKVYFESVGTPYLVSIFLTGILSQTTIDPQH